MNQFLGSENFRLKFLLWDDESVFVYSLGSRYSKPTIPDQFRYLLNNYLFDPQMSAYWTKVCPIVFKHKKLFSNCVLPSAVDKFNRNDFETGSTLHNCLCLLIFDGSFSYYLTVSSMPSMRIRHDMVESRM